MRNMSFQLTTAQIMDETKTVTRRNGWEDLKVGEIFQAIEKGQGLKKGERVNRLKALQCVANHRERLYMVLADKSYGQEEMIKEGFPGMDPINFVTMYCNANKGTHPGDKVSRIEFRYLLKHGRGEAGEAIKVPARVAVCPSCETPLTIYPDGWSHMEDGTIKCDSFTLSCEQDKLYEQSRLTTLRGHEAYTEYQITHYSQWNQPYIYLMPTTDKIEKWLLNTYRFDLD